MSIVFILVSLFRLAKVATFKQLWKSLGHFFAKKCFNAFFFDLILRFLCNFVA